MEHAYDLHFISDALQRFIAAQNLTVTRTSKFPSNNTAGPDYLAVKDSRGEYLETIISTVTELYEVTEYDDDDTDDTYTDDAGNKALRNRMRKTVRVVRIENGMW